jgi:hypothetical protein
MTAELCLLKMGVQRDIPGFRNFPKAFFRYRRSIYNHQGRRFTGIPFVATHLNYTMQKISQFLKRHILYHIMMFGQQHLQPNNFHRKDQIDFISAAC